jgi:hypothetical protein
MGIYVPMFDGGQLYMYSQTMFNVYSASEVNLSYNKIIHYCQLICHIDMSNEYYYFTIL